MKLSQKTWIVISGLMWFGVGVMLLLKGLRLIVAASEQQAAGPLLKLLMAWAKSPHQAALLLICVSLLIGFIKGRTVLAKTVGRIVQRIVSQTGALTIGQAYDKRYWLVLGLMGCLGMLFRFLHLPADIHGGIDVAIGSALINGAMLYFRHLVAPQKAA
jgi:hypothetical protein